MILIFVICFCNAYLQVVQAHVYRVLDGVTVEGCTASFPVVHAPFDYGAEYTRFPAEYGVPPCVNVTALGIVLVLCSAPMLTQSTFKKMLPSYGCLFGYDDYYSVVYGGGGLDRWY